MSPQAPGTSDNEELVLELFCTRARQSDAWLLYLRPTRLPHSFRRCFDRYGKGTAYLDFEDLDRYMGKRGLSFDKRISKLGDVELRARGRSAAELIMWLSAAFASGVRSHDAEADKAAGQR
jgi:hypothetical protein